MKPALSRRERKALAELKHAISNKHNVLWMKLFGSKARGEGDEASDIDVAIVLEKVDWPIEKSVYEACFDLGLKHDILIAPVIFSRKEIADKLIQATPFFRTVVKEGVDI